MKVESLESTDDTAAMESPSYAARLLMVLIKLNFVPVKLDKTGAATFRLFSFRCVLCFACWFLPFICFTAVVIYKVILVTILEFGIPAGFWVAYGTSIAILSSLMLMATCLPFCLGYLVGQAELLIPHEIAPTGFLKLILIWVISASNLFLPEILGEQATGFLFCNKISSSLILLEETFCLGILKMVANSFKRKCQQLKSSGNLYGTAKRILDLYKSIKRGAGPIFLVLYSYNTVSVIILLYQVIAKISSASQSFMGLVGTLLWLYELSVYGQELNENIRSSAALLR